MKVRGEKTGEKIDEKMEAIGDRRKISVGELKDGTAERERKR